MDDLGVVEIGENEEEEEEEEEEDSDEEEEESEESSSSSEESQDEEELPIPPSPSPRVSVRAGGSQVNKSSSKPKLVNPETEEDEEDVEDELNRGEIEGLFCPICIEPWSTDGEHKICCLPCGHIYGLSCIKKWLRQRRSTGKCPQCNRRCTLKDIRILYAARLCVVDDKLHKQVRSLKAKCDSLEKKNAECCNKEVKYLEQEADLSRKIQKLTEENKSLKRSLEDRQRESHGSYQDYQRRVIKDNGSGSQPCSGIFKLQGEFRVDGGRYFDIDASGQLIIVARRLNGMGGMNLLTKISLVAPNEREDIQLPANTKAIRALCVKPGTRLALLASLGKKLSVISTESNNTVLTYDLPAPAWSCSWDVDSSHHIYTGLQNGMVMAFDTRQTRTPLESRTGLSCNPVHTVISVASDSSPSSGTRTLLSASQIGMCEWSIGCSEERPYLIPESENHGVCISLAHSGVGDIVASFRPKIEMSAYQPLSTPSMSCGVEGLHIFYKKTGTQSYQKTCSLLAQVDSIRLPKSTIINKQNHNPMFVSTNEVTSDLVLHDMSKLAVVQRLRTPTNQILDMRCTQIWNSAVLGCLSGDTVQLFS